MMPTAFNAFYLSLFISAARKIIGRIVSTAVSGNCYHTIIPFANHCIIVGRYGSYNTASKAGDIVKKESGCFYLVIKCSETLRYINEKCGGHSSSIFQNYRTTDYLSGRALAAIRARVLHLESRQQE